MCFLAEWGMTNFIRNVIKIVYLGLLSLLLLGFSKMPFSKRRNKGIAATTREKGRKKNASVLETSQSSINSSDLEGKFIFFEDFSIISVL